MTLCILYTVGKTLSIVCLLYVLFTVLRYTVNLNGETEISA